MSTIPTRATLLAKVYGRQPEAQREFAEIYLPVAKRYALQFTKGDHADADEVAQHVVVNFGLKKPIQYDPNKGQFRHLLMVAVRRRWLDLFKVRRRDRHISFSDWLDGVPEDITDITEEECVRAERIREVINSVRADFTPQTWAAFEQRQAGVPSVEVAKCLGMKPNAVDGANDRVKRRLREEFTRLGIVPDGFA